MNSTPPEDDTSSHRDPNGDGKAEVHESHRQWNENEQPSVAVVKAVAAATGVDPVDLPCLADAVDPDALDRLLQGGRAGGETPSLQVQFRYDGCDVRVDRDGHTTVTCPE